MIILRQTFYIGKIYDKKGNKKRKVENALKNLRAFITALDKAAPF